MKNHPPEVGAILLFLLIDAGFLLGGILEVQNKNVLFAIACFLLFVIYVGVTVVAWRGWRRARKEVP